MELTLIGIIATLAVLTTPSLAQNNLQSRWKAADVDNLLANERLLKNYVNCLLDEGPCTPDAKTLKDRLPEVLATQCKSCTPDQKVLGKRVALKLQEKYPHYWKQLSDKYDPEHKYTESFKAFLES